MKHLRQAHTCVTVFNGRFVSLGANPVIERPPLLDGVFERHCEKVLKASERRIRTNDSAELDDVACSTVSTGTIYIFTSDIINLSKLMRQTYEDLSP